MSEQEKDGQMLSAEFRSLTKLCREDASVHSVLSALIERGPIVVAMVLALPFVLPIPLPGLSTPFGCLIVLMGFFSLFGRVAHLPDRFGLQRVSARSIERLFALGEKLAKHLERWVKPRLSFACSAPIRALCALVIMLCGALLALPLPPGTNWPPALAIVAVSIGLLSGDGLVVLMGLACCVFNVAAFAALLHFGIEGIRTYLF